MPEMYLKQCSFTYSALGPFTRNKKRIEIFMQTGNTDYINKNDLDKAWFQHGMAYGKSRKTKSDKFLKNKALKITSNPNYHRYQRGIASRIYKFLNKRSTGSGVATFANESAIKSMPVV